MTPNIWSKHSFTYLWIDMSRDMPPPLGIAGIRHISGYPLRVPLRVGQLEPNSGRYSAKPIELPNMQGLERSLSDHIGVAVWILPTVAADAKESFCGLCFWDASER